jgi:phosphoenolpyruvate synthase/pyruvate phosphate dikinase
MVPVLTEPQATAIASITRDLSHRLGFKADIEGAVTNGKVYLFQARPITTLSPVAPGVSPNPHEPD